MHRTITVTLVADGFSQDYELPADIRLEDLYSRLLAVLKKQDIRFYNYAGIVLETQGAGMLDESASLTDYGIRSGSVLSIVEEEKYFGFR